MASDIFKKLDRVLLEAEVNKSKRFEFESQYKAATGVKIEEGNHYQIQDNKWGVECRIYFDSTAGQAALVGSKGYHVEKRSGGYRSDYPYRVNSQKLFWILVNDGFVLGQN